MFYNLQKFVFIFHLHKFTIVTIMLSVINRRAFDRQSEDPGFDIQRSQSVPFFTENIFHKIYD